MTKLSKNRFALQALFLILFLSTTLTGCSNIINTSYSQSSVQPSSTTAQVTTSDLTVHYIDVGQADCILVQNKGKNLLIDAGNYADYSVIESYLTKQKVSRIHTFILTHPHEDHIGSAAKIVHNFDIGTVYMTNITASSRVYKSLMEELKLKNIKPKYPQPGDNFSLGEAAFTFLGPVAQYKDVNSMSLVVRGDFGSNSFLFTGDCTDEAEKDMLNEGVNLETQVLKVGHHGSRDSSTYIFLKAANPVYSVISCGTGNDYGHPHKEALSRINDVGSTLFRTDKSGTIVATSDGSEITWNTVGTESNKEHVSDGNGLASDKDKVTYSQNYIGNKNSHVFHRPDCASLPKKKNQIKFSTRQKALDAGYTACGKCNP